MARKPQKTALESDPICGYVTDAWKNRKKLDIDSYLCGAIRVNPTSAASGELMFLRKVAKCENTR